MPLIKALEDADIGYDRKGEYQRKQQAILNDTTTDMAAKVERLKALDAQYGKASAPAPTPTPAPANPSPTKYQQFKDAQTEAADSFTAGLNGTPSPAPAAPVVPPGTPQPDNFVLGLTGNPSSDKGVLQTGTQPYQDFKERQTEDVTGDSTGSEDSTQIRTKRPSYQELKELQTEDVTPLTPYEKFKNSQIDAATVSPTAADEFQFGLSGDSTDSEDPPHTKRPSHQELKELLTEDVTPLTPYEKFKNSQTDDIIPQKNDLINTAELTDRDCYLIENLSYWTKYTPKQVIQIFQKLKEQNGYVSEQDMVDILGYKYSDFFDSTDNLAALARSAYRVAMFGSTFETLDANQRRETFERALGIIGMSALPSGKSGGNTEEVEEPEFKPFNFGSEAEQTNIAVNRLPNYNKVTISPDKLYRYSLDPDHPVGGDKAKVFQSVLGFNKDNAQSLIEQVKKTLPHCKAIKSVNQWGTKYVVDMPITGPNGRTAMVKTVWIIRPSDIYPDLVSIRVKKVK